MENKEKMETPEMETETVQEEKIDVVKGIETLETEYQRLQWQLADYKRIMGKEDDHEGQKERLCSLRVL